MKTALTIGFFDGVHLGHQALLRALRAHPHTTILTFSNHPQDLFAPPAPPLLLPLEQKLALLKPYADTLLVLPFTREFANTTFEELLSQFNLSHLLLGKGASFGRMRKGNEEAVRLFANTHQFTVEYLPKTQYNGEIVSSSRIRRAIQENDLSLVKTLLGHS